MKNILAGLLLAAISVNAVASNPDDATIFKDGHFTVDPILYPEYAPDDFVASKFIKFEDGSEGVITITQKNVCVVTFKEKVNDLQCAKLIRPVRP